MTTVAGGSFLPVCHSTDAVLCCAVLVLSVLLRLHVLMLHKHAIIHVLLLLLRY